MGALWGKVRVWFAGKKTILGGGLVILAGVAGVWYGKLEAVDGVTLVGVGLSIAGFASKANRHQAELLTALEGVGQAGVDARAGNRTAAVQDLESTAAMVGYAAGPAILSAAGASLHISGATAAEVATLASSLLPSLTVNTKSSVTAEDLANIKRAIYPDAGGIAK